MVYFTPDFNAFFKELAANNIKEWFDENRSRYAKSVKEPYERFVADLVTELRKSEPDLEADPKKALFRINRDIRFSKDKMPYKLNRAAYISKYGRKSVTWPGYYIQLGPEYVMLGGGSHQPDKEGLSAIRHAIARRPEELHKAFTPHFKETYGEIKGEENKRLPDKELTRAAEREPLIYKKQFFYTAEFPSNIIIDDRLLEFVVEKLHDGKPVHEFLKRVLE